MLAMPTAATTKPMMTRLAPSCSRKRAATLAFGAAAAVVFTAAARSCRMTGREGCRLPLLERERRAVHPRRCRDRVGSPCARARLFPPAARARACRRAGEPFLAAVPARSCSHLQDLLLLGGDQMIDFSDKFVCRLLHLLVGPAVFVFSDLRVFERVFETLVRLAANVANSDAPFFGAFVDEFHQFFSALFVELWQS